MTVTNRCDTIAKILHRRVELQAYKDRASHFALSKALLKQDASEVVSAYNNLFDLIRDFITTIHYSKKEIPGLNRINMHFISFDKFGETCYVVLQPEYELSITLTILVDDPKKIIHSKIVLDDKAPELATINTIDDADSENYILINEAVRASFTSYLEHIIDKLE